ncbi:MAG: DNA polymerase III subunit delta [Gaiellales bacterium]
MSEVKPLGPAYLVHGSDRPKVDQALRRLRDRIGAAGGSVERMQAGEGGDGATAAPGEVVLECNALGLLGGPRLVLVSGIEAWKADQSLAALLAYLAEPAPDATLALVASTALDPKHPLATGKLAGIDVLLYDLPARRELPDWVAKAARAAGASIDRDAVARLLELGGDDAQSLSSEVAKLAAYAQGGVIRRDDVDAISVLERDVPPWDLTDAIGSRDGKAALVQLGRFLDKRDGAVAAALPAIARHLRSLSVARRALERGDGVKELAKTLNMRSEYPARKLLDQARGWSDDQLSRAIVRLALAERETRGDRMLASSYQPERMSLERALAEATGA